MNNRSTLTLVVGTLLIVALLLAATFTHDSAKPCKEDMPCWNCTTMGNKICGPGA